ncbi:hypothetical protein [Streptomyces sp. ATCC 21386]|uniref:hypothetical protein n=1 Tax=Streptomyces sp. ATCC 21386 TaxID=2699428 RepID=UPI002044D2A0|nr:hypothetical protein [Streptomyces sp. ATCC 21386]
MPGAQPWPAPPRFALIACESGGDLRFAESIGLATAMIHNGARPVTDTHWALPTSFASPWPICRSPYGPSRRPWSPWTRPTRTTTPIRHLGAWQRQQLLST